MSAGASWLDEVRWDADGLVNVVAQDAGTSQQRDDEEQRCNDGRPDAPLAPRADRAGLEVCQPPRKERAPAGERHE